MRLIGNTSLAVIFLAIFRVTNIAVKQTELDKLLNGLGDAKPGDCQGIKLWLTDDVIATFHQSILTESRLPIISEVAAMRKHWELRDERMKNAKLERETDAAFEELYGNSLVTE